MSDIKTEILMRIKGVGLSICALEKRASLPRGTIQNIISGKSKNPGIYTVQRIAKALGCPITSLISNDDLPYLSASINHQKSKNLGVRGFIIRRLNILLSLRERECLHYLSQGQTTKEIGKTLDMSPKTVETHIYMIKKKVYSSGYGYPHKLDLIKLNSEVEEF